MLIRLIETGYYGLYHCTNKGYCSRFDVAKRIVDFLGSPDVTVEPGCSAYFPLPALRARVRNVKKLQTRTTQHGHNSILGRRSKDYIESCWI